MDATNKNLTKSFVFIVAAVAALNNCNLGYDMGIVAGVGPILQKQSEFEVSDVQLEIWIGALDISSLVGAFSSNDLADRFGRKGCMALSEVLFIVSVLGMACAQNYATLIAFRCLCGVAVGLGLTIGPLYIGEIAPCHLRGKLISWSEFATNIGLLVAFCAGYTFSGLNNTVSWRLMLGLGALLPCVLLLCLYYMPESPRWLIVQGKEEQAELVLKQVYNNATNTTSMVREIKEGIAIEHELFQQGGWHAIFHPTTAVFYAMLAAVGIAGIQQLSGIEAITSYFLFIFQRAGLESNDTYIYLILFGLCKLVTVYIAGLYFDNPLYGRRKLLLASGIGVAMCMFIFCLLFAFPMSSASSNITIVTMFAYVICYSIGYGPGAWVVMLEVLPMQIRAKGLSIAMLVNRLIATLLSGSFLTLVHSMTYSGYFGFFLVVTTACVVYVYYLIPETQGRSLEQMSTLFKRTKRDSAMITDSDHGGIETGSSLNFSSSGRSSIHNTSTGRNNYDIVRSVLHPSNAPSVAVPDIIGDARIIDEECKNGVFLDEVVTFPFHPQQN